MACPETRGHQPVSAMCEITLSLLLRRRYDLAVWPTGFFEELTRTASSKPDSVRGIASV